MFRANNVPMSVTNWYVCEDGVRGNGVWWVWEERGKTNAIVFSLSSQKTMLPTIFFPQNIMILDSSTLIFPLKIEGETGGVEKKISKMFWR